MKRKILYVPGFISLTFLFVACFIFLKYKNAFKQQAILEVNWWRWDHGRGPYVPEPTRKYITYNLTGNKMQDNQNLHSAQLKIRNLKRNKDTLNGVRLHFKESTKYWAFVKAIDICQVENVTSYYLSKNDILVINIPKPNEEKFFIYGTREATLKIINLDKALDKEFINNVLKLYWPSVFLFLLIILFTIRRQRKSSFTSTVYYTTQLKRSQKQHINYLHLAD